MLLMGLPQVCRCVLGSAKSMGLEVSECPMDAPRPEKAVRKARTAAVREVSLWAEGVDVDEFS